MKKKIKNSILGGDFVPWLKQNDSNMISSSDIWQNMSKTIILRPWQNCSKGKTKNEKKILHYYFSKKNSCFHFIHTIKNHQKRQRKKKVTKHLIIKKCRAVTLIHTVLQKKSVNLSFKKVRLKLKKKSCEIVVGIRNKRRHNQLRK